MAKVFRRREFTAWGLRALLAGVVITISDACGGGGSSGPTSPSGGGSSTGDVTGAITANHGHSAVITRAQLTGGSGLSLQIQGSADHPHTVSLAAGELNQIAAGQRVTVQSTENDLHTHAVTFG